MALTWWGGGGSILVRGRGEAPAAWGEGTHSGGAFRTGVGLTSGAWMGYHSGVNAAEGPEAGRGGDAAEGRGAFLMGRGGLTSRRADGILGSVLRTLTIG